MTSEATDEMHLGSDLLPTLSSALEAFLSSNAKFRIVKSVSSRLCDDNSKPLSLGSKGSSLRPRTLLILDSSFNPPTRAHLSMATSALREYSGATDALKGDKAPKHSGRAMIQQFPRPYRILLLFSVHNADKSPSPASFPHRLALMYASALDMMTSVSSMSSELSQDDIDIDVAITKEPFYSDKSAAIEASGAYQVEGSHHIHLIGYDTFVRFLNPKYYENFSPPLSALNNFFDHHGLRLTLRASSQEEAQDQRRKWESLASGDLVGEGGRKEWAGKIEVVEGEADIIGVSSTAVRSACESRDWGTIERLCPPHVATWIRSQGLYQENATGKI
ncbi:MAG: hypothetical protein Q9159_002248 [Coniocarpon cinnabarinum]